MVIVVIIVYDQVYLFFCNRYVKLVQEQKVVKGRSTGKVVNTKASQSDKLGLRDIARRVLFTWHNNLQNIKKIISNT